MIIITGASDNHYKSLNQFIYNFLNINNNNTNIKLIVYNLELSEENWTYLQNTFHHENIIYKIFQYSLYPDFLNINVNAGEYAWKPVIIYDTCIEYKNDIILWMDSGNIIYSELTEVFNYIQTYGIFSSFSNGSVLEWTYPDTISYMNCEEEILNKQCKNAACLGFDTSKDWVVNFIDTYKNLCLIKDCIAPNGSCRVNHRQDQSVFSILFYKYQKKILYPDGNIILDGYDIHRDID